MVDYWKGQHRTELFGALVLSGEGHYAAQGRHCFQLTYVYDGLSAYVGRSPTHKFVWVLRNPFSVIRSMLYNWDTQFSLNELFDVCGAALLSDEEKALYAHYGPTCFSLVKRAALSYNGKVSQVFSLYNALGAEQLLVLDYDALVADKLKVLPALYAFVDLPYHAHYADKIYRHTSRRKRRDLSEEDKAYIASLCLPVYEQAKSFCQDFSS